MPPQDMRAKAVFLLCPVVPMSVRPRVLTTDSDGYTLLTTPAVWGESQTEGGINNWTFFKHLKDNVFRGRLRGGCEIWMRRQNQRCQLLQLWVYRA